MSKCKKGFSCGASCIHTNYECRVDFPSAVTRHMGGLKETVTKNKPIVSMEQDGNTTLGQLIQKSKDAHPELEEMFNDPLLGNYNGVKRVISHLSSKDNLTDEEIKNYTIMTEALGKIRDYAMLKYEGNMTKALERTKELHGITKKELNAEIKEIEIERNIARKTPYTTKTLREDLKEFLALTGNPDTIATFGWDGDRAYFDKYNSYINLGSSENKWDAKSTLYHELGHNIEINKPEVYKANMAFIRSRATSAEPKPLNDIIGTKAYGEYEIAYEGNYISPYVSKVYNDSSTEVTSMGLQNFHDSKQATLFLLDDPDHFHLTMGTILP